MKGRIGRVLQPTCRTSIVRLRAQHAVEAATTNGHGWIARTAERSRLAASIDCIAWGAGTFRQVSNTMAGPPARLSL